LEKERQGERCESRRRERGPCHRAVWRSLLAHVARLPEVVTLREHGADSASRR